MGDELASLAALNLQYVSKTVCEEIRRSFGTLAEAFSSHNAASTLRERVLKKLAKGNLEDGHREIEEARDEGITLLPYWDPRYPALLGSIVNPPPLLYCHGNIELLDLNAIALVGSRASSIYGMKMSRGFSSALVDSGYAVVSGLAKGIDSAAHTAALESGGKTVAVLGSGLKKIYPAQNIRLAKEVAAKGCLVSEYGLNVSPMKFHFPRRNRIISGLSLATVVIEAGRKSGALITATWAAEQGREVFAVPGPIDTGLSAGCHQLLREGARVAETLQDIEFEIDKMKLLLARRFKPVSDGGQTELEQQIVVDQPARPLADPRDARKKILVDTIGSKGMNIDQIESKTGLGPEITLPVLMEMELEGAVVRKAGNVFACA